MPSPLTAALAAGIALAPIAAAPPKPATPATVLAAAPAADWAPIAAEDLLLIDLAGGARVAIALAPGFAPVHVANIRALARARWYEGASIERVQDNFVTQWGDADGRKPLPPGIARRAPAEYERAAAGLGLVVLPYHDSYAPRIGYVAGFPVAEDGAAAWMAHCYGIVGVGRELSPDTGSGAELYAVIGQAPRALDRNIALVGRVVAGMEHLAALPRGTAELGFYADPRQRVPITRVVLAADLPPGERPAYEWLRPDSASFRAWVQVKANRRDDFYLRPAGAVDLCGALPPVRAVARP